RCALRTSSFLISTSSYLSLFFFQCVRHPPALHSFPTRRSSDLSGEGIIFAFQNDGLIPAAAVRPRGLDPDVIYDVTTQEGESVRSEEHTSELQSPYDLVCRLLLEKKKKERQQTVLEHRSNRGQA